MRPFRSLACLALVAASINGAAAEVPREEVRAYMERSGLILQLSGGAEELRKSFPEQAGAQLPPDILQPLTEVVVAALDDKRLIDAVETAYVEALTPEDLEAANAFIDSPFGQKITKAEIDGSTREAWEEIAAKQKELVAGLQADKERLAVVEGIDKSLRATEVGAAITMSLVRAMIAGGAGGADPEVMAQAEQMIELLRPQMIEESRSLVLASFAQVYRDFSTDELRSYAAYLDTPGARTIYGVYFAAVSDRYTEAGEEIGNGLATLLKQKRS
jgi:hypothetical protein